MPLSDIPIYYEDFVVGAGNSKIPKEVIQYHPFGIGIGTDGIFGISVPESTVSSTEIPNFIRYSQLWISHMFDLSHYLLVTRQFFSMDVK